MAKETPKSAPEIAKLPMGNGENQPVVIDLPDGQKLVVGNLAHGSVIEVATWRGTGRPDSRTSRLMLGMSSAAESEQAKADSAKGAKKSDDEKPSLMDLLLIAGKKTVAFITDVLQNIKNSKPSKPSKPEKIESADAEVSKDSTGKPLVAVLPKSEQKQIDSDLDVDEWLNNLIKKTEAKAAKASTKSPQSAPSKKSTTKKANVRKVAPKQTGRR